MKNLLYKTLWHIHFEGMGFYVYLKWSLLFELEASLQQYTQEIVKVKGKKSMLGHMTCPIVYFWKSPPNKARILGVKGAMPRSSALRDTESEAGS